MLDPHQERGRLLLVLALLPVACSNGAATAEADPAAQAAAEPTSEEHGGGGPKACAVDDDCAGSGCMGRADLGCKCLATPDGLRCVPRCETSSDCPAPPGVEAMCAQSGTCQPKSVLSDRDPGSQIVGPTAAGLDSGSTAGGADATGPNRVATGPGPGHGLGDPSLGRSSGSRPPAATAASQGGSSALWTTLIVFGVVLAIAWAIILMALRIRALKAEIARLRGGRPPSA